MKEIVRPLRIALLLITILGFIGIFSIACRKNAGQAGGPEAARDLRKESEDLAQGKTRGDLSAVLFVNELSCPCTREQCRAAEAVVQILKEDFSGRVRFETIDYELQHEKAKPLLLKYEALMIPLLVLLEGERVLWKCDDFSDENEVRSQFEGFVLITVGKA